MLFEEETEQKQLWSVYFWCHLIKSMGQGSLDQLTPLQYPMPPLPMCKTRWTFYFVTVNLNDMHHMVIGLFICINVQYWFYGISVPCVCLGSKQYYSAVCNTGSSYVGGKSWIKINVHKGILNDWLFQIDDQPKWREKLRFLTGSYFRALYSLYQLKCIAHVLSHAISRFSRSRALNIIYVTQCSTGQLLLCEKGAVLGL